MGLARGALSITRAGALEQVFAGALDQIPLAIVAADEAGRLVEWNEAAAIWLGPDLGSMSLSDLEARPLPEWGHLHIATAPGTTADGDPVTWAVISHAHEDRALLEAFAHQALHDHLTGLPNRTLLNDRLEHALARASRPDEMVSVMFLDLDQFKVINDTQGHATGDALLCAIADRLAVAVRPGDTVARFGGDEFVVICEGVADEADAYALAERLCEAIEAPLQVQGDEVYVTASLGVAVGRSTDTPESLLRDADAAMYQAKLKGRARAELFNAEIRSRAKRRRTVEKALRRALEHEQLRLVYQPIVDLEAGWVVGAEALLRWDHPEQGEVMPAEFIPIAEDTGLIQPIGSWVVDEACHQLRQWRVAVPHVPLCMAVNISARQLRGAIVETVRDAAGQHDIEPSSLVLEITEGVLMDDVSRCRDILQDLHTTGVRLAIDDFGVGYSSLSYLKQFPIDIIKIDRAFIDGLGTEPHDSAIVTAIVGMARALKVSLVAEGVETAQQLHALRHLGCQQAQGFHLAKPMEAAAFEALLHERRRW